MRCSSNDWGSIVYLSLSGRRLLGYADDDKVEGMSLLDIIHPDERAAVIERAKRLRGTPEPVVVPVERRVLREKDGSTITLEVVPHGIMIDGEQAAVAIARDVSARKAFEAQLVLKDRLASLGRLSASIGHELNNPLHYVLGNLEMMQKQLESAALDANMLERLNQHLTLIRDGAMRMRDIVRT